MCREMYSSTEIISKLREEKWFIAVVEVILC